MRWNWQLAAWPDFFWDYEKLQHAEKIWIEGAGIIAGASRYINPTERQALLADLMSMDALDTSEIEGEFLNRSSVHSSIKKALGLQADNKAK